MPRIAPHEVSALILEGSLQGMEDCYIKWLHLVSAVWRQGEHHYAISLAEVNRIHGDMALMVVNHEQYSVVRSAIHVLHEVLQHLYEKPGVHPATWVC